MMTNRSIPRWFPFALLLGVLIALFHPLLRGETLFWGLPSLQFYPWRQFAFDELGAGRLPTWNPYLGAGAPLLANYQTAVFYPPNWLHLVMPGPQAMSVIALGHVLWAAGGMWLLAGELAIPTFGRGISTLSYALSGYLIARLGSFPTADAVAWVPWVFWLVHRVVIGRRLAEVGGLALFFALQLLAGHAQTVWYGSVGVGLYAVWLAVNGQSDQSRVRRLRGLALAGGGLALGAVMAVIQLLPTAEYLLESPRSDGLDYQTLTNFSYHPLRLLTLLSPDFFGTPADGSYLTEGVYFEDAAYIGFIPLVAALAAMVARYRRRRELDQHPLLATVPAWAGLAMFGFFLAMGRHNPLFRPLADYVPTFDTFRDPARWLILIVLSFSVLAGIGVQYWGRGKWIVFWSRLAAAGGGAMVVMALVVLHVTDMDSETLEVLAEGIMVLGSWIAGAALLTLTHPVGPDPVSPAPISSFLWRVTVLVFVALDLAWMGSGLNPTVPDEYFTISNEDGNTGRLYWFEDYERIMRFGSEEEDTIEHEGYFNVADYRIATNNWREVRDSRLPNMNMLDRVPSLNNFDPLVIDYHRQYIDLIEVQGANAGNLLQATGVDRVYGLTPTGWTGQNPAIAPYIPAVAWLVPQAEQFDSDEAVKAALTAPGWNPRETVILTGEKVIPLSSSMSEASVAITEQSPIQTHFRVTTNGAAYLVIGQAWYPGWHAALNGDEIPLHRANLAFQAVAVPPGEHDLVVTYSLNRWELGVGVSVLGLVVTLGLIGWGISRRR